MPLFSSDPKEDVCGTYPCAVVPFVLSWRRPEYPELLDAEIRTAAFDEKWNDFLIGRREILAAVYDQLDDDEELGEEVTLDELYGRLEDGDKRRQELAELKTGITGDEIRSVLDWIDDVLIRLEPAEDLDDTIYEDDDGEEVTDWADLPEDVRTHILGQIPPWEVVVLFRDIKKSVGALSPQQKKD